LISELVDNLESEAPVTSLNLISKPKHDFKKTTDDHKPGASCFKKAIYGVCDRVGCTYSHIQADLEAKNRELIKTAMLSPYYKSSSSATNSSHLFTKQSLKIIVDDNASDAEDYNRNERRGKGNKVKKPPSIEVLNEEEEPSDSDAELNLLSNFALDQIRSNAFLYHFPEVNLHTSMYREGRINLSKNSYLDFGTALFDSGALHASYVSKKFVDRHRRQLSPYIRKYNSKVRLGDS
jgi:hypothetical protein